MTRIFAKPAAPLTWEDLARAANYDIRKLAELCEVSPRTLQRYFLADHGLSPRKWLRAVQFRNAYQRITAGESVKSVAYSLGFTELSNFSRAFKAQFGVAPSMVSPPPIHRRAIFSEPILSDISCAA